MQLLPTFLSLLVVAVCASAEPSNASGSGALYPPGLLPLITRANTLLSTGQFNDAVRAYTDAIDQSPTDSSLFYKRATAYLSLGRHQPALADFDRVLVLTHNTFDKAYLQQARIHARDGNWAAARTTAKRYAERAGGGDGSEAADVLFSVSEGEMAERKARQMGRAGLHTACIEAATEAIRTATHSIGLRQLRADCALHAGELQQHVGDLVRLTHLTPPSSDGLLRIANTAYFLLQSSPQALSSVKQCLHYDPDSKPCSAAHRTLKKLDRTFAKLDEQRAAGDWSGIVKTLTGERGFLADFDAALDSATATLTLPAGMAARDAAPRRAVLLHLACTAHTQLGQPARAEPHCEAVLARADIESDALRDARVDALVGRGEVRLKREEWEEAVHAFEAAFEAGGRQSQDVHARLQKAQRLLKQARKKDYYKVLGVARDADERTIKKAYRRAAKLAHPDKGGTEAKMASVNEAYEVLSNPELRQRFDNGDDPNDPMAQQGGHPFQQGGGGHPFAHFFQQGGFPGGGGQGGFQFHFSGN